MLFRTLTYAPKIKMLIKHHLPPNSLRALSMHRYINYIFLTNTKLLSKLYYTYPLLDYIITMNSHLYKKALCLHVLLCITIAKAKQLTSKNTFYAIHFWNGYIDHHHVPPKRHLTLRMHIYYSCWWLGKQTFNSSSTFW